MGKHTTYENPSGAKIEISLEEIMTRTRTTPFWKRRVPAWQAGLFLAIVAGLFMFTFWADHALLTCANYEMFCNR